MREGATVRVSFIQQCLLYRVEFLSKNKPCGSHQDLSIESAAAEATAKKSMSKSSAGRRSLSPTSCAVLAHLPCRRGTSKHRSSAGASVLLAAAQSATNPARAAAKTATAAGAESAAVLRAENPSRAASVPAVAVHAGSAASHSGSAVAALTV